MIHGQRGAGGIHSVGGLTVWALACALLGWTGVAQAKIHVNTTLPLCEPSGVHALPDGRLLVVDDEQQREAYLVTLAVGNAMPAVTPIFVPRTKDMEAIAGVGADVLIVGSHSRRGDKGCTVDGRRMRAVRAPLRDDMLQAPARLSWAGRGEGAVKKKRLVADRAAFFEGCDPQDAALCRALQEAEAAAPGDARACARALNIEGAAVAAGQIWLGLRAPQIEGDAVLMRVPGAIDTVDRLRPEGHARLNLGGRAIRGLAADASHLYGIAGPVGDAEAGAFELFRVPIKALVPGARLTPQIVGGLPIKSEGITVLGDRLVIVTDGEAPAQDGAACPTPGRLLVVDIPR